MDATFISKYVDKHSWLYAAVEYNLSNDIQINVEHKQLIAYREKDKSIMAIAEEFLIQSWI